MTVSARKITAFAKLVAGLADTPNLGSTTLLKQWFDSSPEELRVSVNGLIDDLIATAAGASGTEQIGSAAISGVAGATAYAQLVDLKNQLTSAVMGSLTTETIQALTQKIGIINKNFDIWQRGTSFTNPASGAYTADRWSLTHNGTGVTRTISRQNTNPGELSDTTYYYRYAVSAAGTGNTTNQISQPIESVRNFAGKRCTISFYAKADVNRIVNVALDQVFGVGGSATVFNAGGLSPNINLTTTWQLFSYTLTLPDITGKTIGTDDFLRIFFSLPSNAIFTIDIAQVQINAGGAILPFQPRSFADELALCQRYYESLDFNALSSLFRSGTNLILCKYPFKAQKRVPPTLANAADLSITLGSGSKQVTLSRISDNASITATGNVTLIADNATFMTKNMGSVYFSAATSFSGTSGDALYIQQSTKDTLTGFDSEF